MAVKLPRVPFSFTFTSNIEGYLGISGGVMKENKKIKKNPLRGFFKNVP